MHFSLFSPCTYATATADRQPCGCWRRLFCIFPFAPSSSEVMHLRASGVSDALVATPCGMWEASHRPRHMSNPPDQVVIWRVWAIVRAVSDGRGDVLDTCTAPSTVPKHTCTESFWTHTHTDIIVHPFGTCLLTMPPAYMHACGHHSSLITSLV
jgi:hypothetical protein